MPECSKCETGIRSGSLCEICALERAHAGVDHDADAPETCACCGQHAPDGDYGADATGVWLCGPCQALDLTPREYAALLAETPSPLGGICEWAIGVDDAYPDADPADLEAGFETASTRLVADGSGQSCTHCGDPIDRGPDDPPLRFEGEPALQSHATRSHDGVRAKLKRGEYDDFGKVDAPDGDDSWKERDEKARADGGEGDE